MSNDKTYKGKFLLIHHNNISEWNGYWLIANLSFDDFCLLFLKRTDVPAWQEFLFPVSLTKFVCPWPVLSLSNLNGISDEYKIQIQVSQDKQYFDCILNKRGTNSQTENTNSVSTCHFPRSIKYQCVCSSVSTCRIDGMIYY